MEGVAKFFPKKMEKRAEVAAKLRAKKSNPLEPTPQKKGEPALGFALKKYYENNKKTYASASAVPPIGGAIISPSGFGSAALTSACTFSAFLRYSSGSVGVNSPLAIL